MSALPLSSKSLLYIRGGQISSSIPSVASKFLTKTPDSLFNALFFTLCSTALIWKGYESSKATEDKIENKPDSVKRFQINFLSVFWLLRMADWLQGPYFYDVYASKIINGLPVSLDLVSKLFLVGFATTGLLGPWVGRQVDIRGRKFGTISFAALYALGALSTQSAELPLLLLGRVAGGIGTSLLFSAPEAWMVGEHQRLGHDSKWLGQTFGWAYAGDSLVAIAAGQLASMVAGKLGPTGPFTLSILFLTAGSILASLRWKENIGVKNNIEKKDFSISKKPQPAQAKKLTIKDAWAVMVQDKRILLVGAVQALFEGAMYIFVLQWPPALKAIFGKSPLWAAGTGVPYGKVFSCFMASCLLGSTTFGALRSRNVKVESTSSTMLACATAAMALATSVIGTGNLAGILAAFFIFEMCVGMYFPSIGTLRSKYIPDSHRSVIMNIFGIPLNLIVVSVYLSIGSLGVKGAMAIATGALAIATICMGLLARI